METPFSDRRSSPAPRWRRNEYGGISTTDDYDVVPVGHGKKRQFHVFPPEVTPDVRSRGDRFSGTYSNAQATFRTRREAKEHVDNHRSATRMYGRTAADRVGRG